MNLTELYSSIYGISNKLWPRVNRNDVPVFIVDHDGKWSEVDKIELQESGVGTAQVAIWAKSSEKDRRELAQEHKGEVVEGSGAPFNKMHRSTEIIECGYPSCDEEITNGNKTKHYSRGNYIGSSRA